MKRLNAVASLSAACLMSPLVCAEYSGEVSLGYENLDSNFSGDDLYIGQFTWYTTPLHYGGKTPYDEAGFVNQIGKVDILYGRATGDSLEVDSYGLSYQYRNASTPHAFSASWVNVDFEQELNGYDIGYQYYLSRGFTVGADVSYADFAGEQAWSYGVSSKKVFSLEKERWFALEGGLGWTDDAGEGDWALSALAMYYPSARTGIGIGTVTTDRFADFDSVLTASHCLKENLAVTLSYNRSFLKRESDTDGVSFGGKFRF